MPHRILGPVLTLQGTYYSLTGLWALVSLESFSRVTGHRADPFEMHSIAALSLVVGLFLIWAAFREDLRRPAGVLAVGLVLAVMIPELVYLPRIGNPPLFWVDFALEGALGVLLTISLSSRSH